MDNLLPALQSVGHTIRITFRAIAMHDASWGFLTGFFTATGLFAVIMSENPRHLPILLTKSSQKSFEMLAARDIQGTFCASYTSFQREYNRVRSIFYLSLLAFFVVVSIALLRY
jgi:hypothetical protein